MSIFKVAEIIYGYIDLSAIPALYLKQSFHFSEFIY